MSKFKMKPTVGPEGYFSAKLKGDLTDNDVGKPVKLSTDTESTYELCADGDGIDAFIVGLEPGTIDGLKFGTLIGNAAGVRVRVEASGAMNVGDLVESGAVAAAGTAETNKLALVSTHAAAADDIVRWRVVAADTTDGSITNGDQTVVIERL